ncbi:MAG: acyl carrier protein [Tissierellia bacterium]|nr:acyl carrier protein [Tissierellia bacterium]
MEQRVIEIIAEQFQMDPKELSLSMTFKEDLDADSIELVELIMTLEEEFNIEVEDDQLEKIKTIGDVVEQLELLND